MNSVTDFGLSLLAHQDWLSKRAMSCKDSPRPHVHASFSPNLFFQSEILTHVALFSLSPTHLALLLYRAEIKKKTET